MKILLPSSTQPASGPSPSRRARVVRPATSLPAPGSVIATAVMVRPAVMPGIQRAFCAGVPAWCRCGPAMSVCTSTVITKPAERQADSDSANTRLVSASASPPP